MTLQQTKSTSKILKFRETHTLAETGKKFGLTAERVRQIGKLKDRKRCEKHKRYYFNSCSHCLGESYRTYVNKLNTKDFYKEITKERKNRKRDYLSVWRRIYLTQRLLWHGHSVADIAKFLKRDYSTIKHSLKKIKL